MNEDKLIIAIAKDKLEKCQNNYMITNTVFLDMRQQTLCRNILGNNMDCRGFFYGGYDEAERQIALFLPEYIPAKSAEEVKNYFEENKDENPLSLIRVTHSGYKELNHRDYLGSLIGLGIKRESIGDIIVYKGGADVIVLKELTEFLLANYNQVGRTEVQPSNVNLSDIKIPEGHMEEKGDTVASLRLDNVISSAFNLSRTAATTAIKSGIVFVNNMQIEKPDKTVSQGDKLVLRGKGKVILKEIGGNTKKDRIYITLMLMK
ncbi:MAG: RNA-binding protein [Aminipila sp.]